MTIFLSLVIGIVILLFLGILYGALTVYTFEFIGALMCILWIFAAYTIGNFVLSYINN